MQSKMRAAILAVVASAVSTAATADVVQQWNQEALKVFSPVGPPQARTLAMVHVAMHDAINAVTGDYETYLRTPPVPQGASSTAAGAGAAYQVLLRLFPDMQSTWDTALATSIAGISDPARTDGVKFGRRVGEAMFVARSSDGFSTPVSFTPGSGPGVWVPTEPLFKDAILPGLGSVVPFALRSGSQFRPDGPPALSDDLYTADFNEIKVIGSGDLKAPRTTEQTATALFWLGNSIPIFQGIARQVSTDNPLSESASARFFALMSIAGFDAYIAAWDAKYTYQFWRPVTAIRNADTDGNPDTTADVTWTPFADILPAGTPPFPDYVSGHTTYTGAVVHILEHVFGRGFIQFDAINANPAVPARHYEGFRALSDEMIEARVLAGIHFRTADVDGDRLGRQVAQFAIAHLLRAARPSRHE